MITGINTDIKYKGKVYHVQTEEKEPFFETLVYHGGAILKKKTYNYIKYHGNSLTPDEIRKLLEKHHKEILLSIKNGLLEKKAQDTKAGQKPSRENNPNLNTLDELLIKYLSSKKTV